MKFTVFAWFWVPIFCVSLPGQAAEKERSSQARVCLSAFNSPLLLEYRHQNPQKAAEQAFLIYKRDLNKMGTPLAHLSGPLRNYFDAFYEDHIHVHKALQVRSNRDHQNFVKVLFNFFPNLKEQVQKDNSYTLAISEQTFADMRTVWQACLDYLVDQLSAQELIQKDQVLRHIDEGCLHALNLNDFLSHKGLKH